MSSDIWISTRQDRAPNAGRDAMLALVNGMEPASGCYSFCLNDAKNTLNYRLSTKRFTLR